MTSYADRDAFTFSQGLQSRINQALIPLATAAVQSSETDLVRLAEAIIRDPQNGTIHATNASVQLKGVTPSSPDEDLDAALSSPEVIEVLMIKYEIVVTPPEPTVPEQMAAARMLEAQINQARADALARGQDPASVMVPEKRERTVKDAAVSASKWLQERMAKR